MKIEATNILLVSGSGQNTGKTTLVCRLIEKFASDVTIVSIKITHHFKTLAYEMPIVLTTKEFVIYEEIERGKSKDSSRMLDAGASKSYFIIAQKESIVLAMSELLLLLTPQTSIICESGGLDDYYKVGLHLHLVGSIDSGKPSRDSDLEVKFDGTDFDLPMQNISFENNSWHYKL
jgi:hypothetical protein